MSDALSDGRLLVLGRTGRRGGRLCSRRWGGAIGPSFTRKLADVYSTSAGLVVAAIRPGAGLGQSIMPPDASIRSPLIQAMSSDSRVATMGPISSGLAGRPSAVISPTRLR